ncbi:hypothetical protein HTVC103P_gp13 [Pelagibacter phage HTVC103P]|jgi:hypothetical protein|nr:hypothetical protein HTVC103P_gp13 [Pelagibacter phage HTVC103P]
MKELKFELKLLKIMELLHENKVRLLEDKPVLYTSIADIHNRVELIYDTVKNNQYKPEYHNINGGFKELHQVTEKKRGL